MTALLHRRVPGSDMTDVEYAIRTEGLRKEFGDTVAVEGLELAVEPGTVYGFLGPNGAGKTTTMRMLATLTEPTGGGAWVAGEPVGERDAVRPSIGYLPEEPPVYDELTGREQLEYVAGLRGMPREQAAGRIDELLRRFDLADEADDRIDSYSKGMRQKVGISGAILHEPAVLFLDEPTSGLDPRAARTVRETVGDLAADDVTVFLSTHILPVVDELADTVGVLHDGQLVAEGAPESLKERAEAGDADSGGAPVDLEEVFLEVTRTRGATG
jgi:ABC-2 type transport system ATP-binding protein